MSVIFRCPYCPEVITSIGPALSKLSIQNHMRERHHILIEPIRESASLALRTDDTQFNEFDRRFLKDCGIAI